MPARTPAPEAPRPQVQRRQGKEALPGASPSSRREGFSPGTGSRARSPGLPHVLTCLVVRPCPLSQCLGLSGTEVVPVLTDLPAHRAEKVHRMSANQGKG